MTYDASVSAALGGTASPESELTRADWVALLARLSSAFSRSIERGGSPAWPRLPGANPADRICGLEGFARMSLAWGAWLGRLENPAVLRHGDRDVDILDLVVRGLSDGSDPSGPWFWGPIGDREQRIVEAAELASGLWLGRRRIAPALGPERLDRLLAWLAQVHGRDVYADNWVLFPSIVATVSRGLGATVDDGLIDGGIDTMLGWYRGDGWYSDGEGHAFDRYTGWAVHWHLLLWAAIEGSRRPRTRDLVVARARTWLRDLPALAAADGAIPFFGRSLGYRFATAAPLGLAALLEPSLGPSPVEPGLARRVMSRSIAYHLAHDAIDDATDWLRVGVHGERRDVCERYMSAGAVAWSTRVLVPLGLGPDDAFWRAPEQSVPAERGDGELVLRGPGWLVGWEHASGTTWVASALADHPGDIPGHDYRSAYGKVLFHSAFPFTHSAADRLPGPDAALVLEDGQHIGHRDAVDAGGVGPGWVWSRYRIDVGGHSHGVTSVAIRSGDAWVRAVGVRPRARLQAVTATVPLGVAEAAMIRRVSRPDLGVEAATDGVRWVAIRRLVGYDEALPSGPARGGADRNLVAQHSEQPSVRGSLRARGAQLLVSADVARARDVDPIPDLCGVSVERVGASSVIVRLKGGDSAFLAAGGRPPRRVCLDGWSITGPALRVVRIGPGGTWFAGEAIAEVHGVVRLDRPGPVEVRRLADGGVLVGTTAGVSVDPVWAAASMGRVSAFGADGWGDATPLESPGVVPARLVRALQRATGHTFVQLRLDR
jgi:hypothetical protein